MDEQLRDEPLPDSTVTTEYSFMLKPSQIDVGGVGVFATHDIASGSYLRLFPPDEEPRLIDPEVNKHFFVQRFGVPSGNMRWCPKDFGSMSVVWYLNHSSNPNACFKDDNRYYVSRDIRSGEEITIDYETLLCETLKSGNKI